MKKPIYTCMWFDGNAKEAADFYCSVFKDSKILSENPMVVMFELNGTKFMGLNGGSQFKPTEATSFVVECENQQEIDHYWDNLTKGGAESMCGWLRDKYGYSWQIVPASMGKLMSDPKRFDRVMKEVLKMKKLNLEVMENA